MDKAGWQQRRPAIRAQLWTLLGDMPPLFTPHVRIIKTTQHEGYRLEHIAFDNGADATVYGYMLIPDNLNAPAPAILYCHLHGGKYHLGKEMILTPYEASGYADGIELVRRGYIVLAIGISISTQSLSGMRGTVLHIFVHSRFICSVY